jgi:hypothetical protein
MQVRVAKTDARLFQQFAYRAPLVFVEHAQLLKEIRINLYL